MKQGLQKNSKGVERDMRKRRPEKYELYEHAYMRLLNKYRADQSQNQGTYLVKMAWLGVKIVGSQPDARTREEAVKQFEFIEIIQGCLSTLRPKQFEQLFPIEKKYDGEKYEVKDYFYTRKYMDELPQDEPIGQNISELLWEYQNWDINFFTAESMGAISAMRRFDGHLGLFEEFMAQQGKDTPNTFKNSKGQAYYVRHGKPQKIKTSKSDYLRLVKG